jgi:transposase-like protein
MSGDRTSPRYEMIASTRRRWLREQKLAILAEIDAPGGSVSEVARRHTQSGSGKLSWIRGLVAGDPHADSQACLTCHKMPDTAFNAHSASAEALEQSTERLTKIAAETRAPLSALVQNIAFPTDVAGRGRYCATCHQEHQGVNFNLSKISNEQCQSCHVAKFDSFDGHHPEFENYPFRRSSSIR